MFRVLPDGTMMGAPTLEKLEGGTTTTEELWFESGQMKIRGPEEWCGEGVGTYEASLQPGGSLRFSVVADECTERVYAFEGNRDPANANPYELEFVQQE